MFKRINKLAIAVALISVVAPVLAAVGEFEPPATSEG
jgi:hypothetical protein